MYSIPIPAEDRSLGASPPRRRGLWVRAATLLFEASPALRSEVERRQARLLASLGFVLTIISVWGAIGTGVLFPESVGPELPMVLVVEAILSAIAYALSRTRHIQTATFFALGVQWAMPMLTMLLGTGSAHGRVFSASSWLSLLLILSVGILDVKTTVLVVLATVLVPLTAAATHAAEEPGDVAQALSLALSAGGLAIVINRHRHNVERDRQAELRARNEELSALGERLAAKSAELAKSNFALDNAYRDLQQNQRSLLLSEKMASLGRLTAGIAHEMGSPLAAVRTSVAEARALTDEYDRSIGDAEITEEDHHAIAGDLARSLELAAKASERAASFVRNIKDRTRDVGAHEAAPFDAVATIHDALQMLAHEVSRTKSRVVFEPPEPQIRLVGYAGKLGQVITNLVSNALDANAQRGGGAVRVGLARETMLTGASPRGDVLVLTVEDEGPGIPEGDMPRIFEPLFTTKPVGQGTGLGLTIVHDIVKGDLRGDIEAANVPGGGARFVVRFPAIAPP